MNYFRQPLQLVLLMLLLADLGQSVVRRCFSCRSRGELGDCRDPFYLSGNSTIIESKQNGVDTPPCASGWCSKILEGVDKTYKDADYGAATQRECLQRPPSDGKERCAYVKYNHKKVFMCFCKGDLCNGANQIRGASPMFVAFWAVFASLAVSRIFPHLI